LGVIHERIAWADAQKVKEQAKLLLSVLRGSPGYLQRQFIAPSHRKPAYIFVVGSFCMYFALRPKGLLISVAIATSLTFEGVPK
jgi:hypothetical protein